jgi:hypothetical protein
VKSGTDIDGCRDAVVVVLDELADDANETAGRDVRGALDAPEGQANPDGSVKDIVSCKNAEGPAKFAMGVQC